MTEEEHGWLSEEAEQPAGDLRPGNTETANLTKDKKE